MLDPLPEKIFDLAVCMLHLGILVLPRPSPKLSKPASANSKLCNKGKTDWQPIGRHEAAGAASLNDPRTEGRDSQVGHVRVL